MLPIPLQFFQWQNPFVCLMSEYFAQSGGRKICMREKYISGTINTDGATGAASVHIFGIFSW